MRKYLSILFLVSISYSALAQLGNNGALISVKSGATLSVHEEVVNYNGGEFHNTDTIYLFDDWTNNAGNEAFISLGVGIVHMHGADQRIMGTDITRFYDLRLEQTGIKYGDLDVYVDGFLRLNDRRFHMDTNCVSVFNSDLLSVENVGLGYVSALDAGGLMRNVESVQPYLYPVGWPNYYRPLELEMSSANLNQMKVRMAFTDATNEGFDRESREPTLCEVIPTFYHRVYQLTGTDSARVKIHYAPAVDGIWETIAHYQNVPQWEDTGDQDAGIDPVTGLNYYNTIAFNTNFADPAFALATTSIELELVADDTTICQGQAVTFTAEAGHTTYHFIVNGVIVQTGPDNTYVTTTLQDGDIVSFIAEDPDCIFLSTEITMVVYPLPIATASNDSPVCDGTTLSLFSNGGVSYEWEGPNSFTSTDQNPTINPASLLSAGTYTVTATDANGCANTATTEVEIFDLPVVTINSNSPVCVNDSLGLTADGGVSYEWEGPNSFTSTDQNPSILSATLLNGGTYTVTVTDANGCMNSATTDVIVNDLPSPTAVNDSPVCLGNDVNLIATGGTNYEWEGPNGFTSASQNPSLINTTLLANGTYTVTVSDGNSCSATAETIVIINDLPTPTASNDSPVCDGTTLSLFSDGGVSYEWEGPNSFTSTDQNPTINPASLLSAGTYTVTATDANGCANTATTEVEIFDLPVVTINSNSPVCVNDSLGLTADGGVSYEWEGPNGFTSTDQNPSILSATLLNGGTYTVTITDANGCMNSATTDVIVNDLPSPTAVNDSPVCLGNDVNLIATGGTNYEWEGPNGFTSTSQNPSLINTTLLANGTYTVTVTDGNSCSATAETIVIINDLPTPTASSDSPICDGTTLSLFSNGGVSYEWEGPNSFTSTDQNPTINPASLLSAGTYTVTATDANGCANTATTEVFINELPVITIGSNSPICVNETINLVALGGVNYEWEGPNGFSSVNQNPNIPSATALNSGTYTVTITDANGCINSATTDVIVNDLPSPTANNDSPVCFGDNVNLIATGGTNYEWEGPDGFASTSQNPSLINTTALANGTYTVTVTDGNSCTATAETIVTINSLPNSGAFSNSPICNGDILTLTGTGGVSYEWEGPNGFAMTGATPVINPVTLLSAGIYTVTVTDINGCTNVSITNVIVNELPVVTANSNSPICENETIILNADGGVSYEWEGPDSFTSTNQNPNISSATLNNTGTYTVTVTDANGCINTNTTTVIINELPTILANNDSPVCPGFDVQLSASGGDSYIWSSSTGFTSNEQNPLLSNVDINNNGVYTVTATDSNGCISTASTTVQIFAPVAQVASNNSPVCLGETVQLSVTGDPNWTYEWSNTNGYSATGQNPSFEGDEINDSGTYSVTITDNNGCEGVFNTTVVVSDFPSIETETDATACEFASVQLMTTYNPIWEYEWEGPNDFIDSISDPILENVSEINEGYYYVSVTNATGCEVIDTVFLDVYDDLMAVPYGDTVIYETESTVIGVSDGVNVIWNPTNTLNCPDCLDVVAMPEETTVYQVIVSDEYGCLDTFNITVEVETREVDELIVPNTITPNGDGKNDTWFIPWLSLYPDNEVVILNRWGDEIFKAKPYQNNFGGKYNGRDLPPGTYYFILLLGEDFPPFKGPLTIIRE